MSDEKSANELPTHSAVGASSATRWMTCPGSVKLSEGVHQVTSSFAEEGTFAHKVASDLLEGKDPGEVSDEMLEAVNTYVDYVRELARANGSILYVEEKFHLALFHPLLFGTADAVVYDPKTKRVEVIDLKYGAGVAVEVEDNSQLKYYALGALLKTGHKCESVRITVVQPRCFHSNGPIRSWDIDPATLIDFGGSLLRAVEETQKPGALLVAGDHCRWCPAKGICPILAKIANEIAATEFKSNLSYDPEILSQTLAKLASVEAYIDGVRAFAYSEASRGIPIPGWKLVPKRASRKWLDESEAKDVVRKSAEINTDDCFETKFKSVAQVKLSIGAEKFRTIMEPLVVSISSGNTLVPESDKRQATHEHATTVFQDHVNSQKILD